MPAAHFTRLRGRTTYFRRRVPGPLRNRLASSEICVKLGIINRDSAMRRGRRLAVAVDAFFEEAVSNPMLVSADLAKVIETTVRSWQEGDARSSAKVAMVWGGSGQNPREEASSLAEMADMVLATLARGRNMHDGAYVSSRYRTAGTLAPSNPIDLHRAGQGLSLGLAAHYLRSAILIAERYALYEGHGTLPVDAWRRHLHLLEQQIGASSVSSAPVPAGAPVSVAAPAARPAPASAPIPVEAEPVGDCLLSFVDVCFDERIKTKQIVANARHEAQAPLKIWTEICGDRPPASYTRQDFIKFRSTLIDLPKSYWKSAKERRKPIRRVIAEAKAKDGAGYARVSNVTVNKHLSAICPIFDWLTGRDVIPKSHRDKWAELQLPKGVRVTGLRPNEERPAFSRDQIAQIFRHPVFTGRQSVFVYNKPGKVILRDSLYWGFLVAAFHPMRREEFAQLTVQCVKQVDGIWVFDLHHHSLALKNPWSARLVPLHKRFLELGFIEALVEGRNGSELLFKELSRSAVHEKYGDEVGRRASRVLDSLGIVLVRRDGSEVDGVFHPFRHRIITDLLNKWVPAGVVDALSGHASEPRKTERARYTEEYFVHVLKDALDQLEPPIDIELLDQKWKEFGRAAVRRPRQLNRQAAGNRRDSRAE